MRSKPGQMKKKKKGGRERPEQSNDKVFFEERSRQRGNKEPKVPGQLKQKRKKNQRGNRVTNRLGCTRGRKGVGKGKNGVLAGKEGEIKGRKRGSRFVRGK